jgi:hypothetical protein
MAHSVYLQGLYAVAKGVMKEARPNGTDLLSHQAYNPFLEHVSIVAIV